MQQEDAAVEKVSVSSFPNRATSIVCDYVDKQGLNGPVKSIQPHFRMLCLEAKKSHPFFVCCVCEGLQPLALRYRFKQAFLPVCSSLY